VSLRRQFMRVKLASILVLGALVICATTARATGIRSGSSYGDPTTVGQGITVALQSSPDSNGFLQIVVCGGGNTTPATTSLCTTSDNDQSGAQAGVFDLLVNVPALSAGTVVDFTLPFSPTSSNFGILVDCPGQFNPMGDGALFACVTPSGISTNSPCTADVNNNFSSPGSSMSWTVPACAVDGVTLFFEDDSPVNQFASISLSGGTVAASESSSLSYLGIALALVLASKWRTGRRREAHSFRSLL
jgi:hypothetical protein